MTRFEVRLSGSGGQGMILAGVILGEAAGIHEGKHVCQTQSYGPEARGGASRSDVVISDEEIDYPKGRRLDVLLALNQESHDEYVKDLKPDGLLVIDSEAVRTHDFPNTVAVPVGRIAVDEVGLQLTTNIVALGVICGLIDVVSPKSLEKAVLGRVPKGTQEVNKRALELGLQAAQKACAEEKPTA